MTNTTETQPTTSPAPICYKGTSRLIQVGDTASYPTPGEVPGAGPTPTTVGKVTRVGSTTCTLVPQGMNAPFTIKTVKLTYVPTAAERATRARSMVEMRVKAVARAMVSHIEGAKETISKFQARLAASPWAALDGCDGVFTATAALELWTDLRARFGEAPTTTGIFDMHQFTLKHTLTIVRWGTHRSTSATANVWADAKVQVAADVTEELGRAVETITEYLREAQEAEQEANVQAAKDEFEAQMKGGK